MKKTTRRALFLSFASMFLCFTMLLGTTYAWFTDSVESGVNQIVAGNLDIELYNGLDTTADKVDGETALFDIAKSENESEKWEPGAMVYENFTIANVGDLALKYQFSLNAANATEVTDAEGNKHSFASMLKVLVVENGIAAGTTRDALKAETGWKTLDTFILPGDLAKGENDVYGIAIWWEPSDNDNLFNMNNGKTAGSVKIDLGVKLYATQVEAESDSFGEDYDEDAWHEKFEVVSAADLQAAINNGEQNIQLVNDIELDEAIVIPAPAVNTMSDSDDAIVIDLNGKKITSNLTSGRAFLIEGAAEIKNGTITTTNGVGGIYVTGKSASLILTDMTIAVTGTGTNAEWNLTAVGAAGGAKVVINNGTYSAEKGYGLVVMTSGADVTINDGIFTTEGSTQSAAIRFDSGWDNSKIYTKAVINGGVFNAPEDGFAFTANNAYGKDITINGGTFNGELDSAYQDNGVMINGGTFNKTIFQGGGHQDKYLIMGGTFVENVNAKVAEGYAATQNADGTYTVAFPQKSFEDLFTDVAVGDTVKVPAGTYTFPSFEDTEIPAGVVIECAPGTVFEGTSSLNVNGATVIGATFSNESGMAVSGTINGTFKDCVFEGAEALRWCYSKEGETVVFENCEIKTDFRGVHFDTMDGDVIFRNCKINGFNAFGGAGTVAFEGCTFGYDESYYNGLNMYCNTVLKDCKFEYRSNKSNFVDFEAAGMKLVIDNCTATMNGEAANILDFVGGTYKNKTTIIVDGAYYATTNDQFKAAVDAGAKEIWLADGEYDLNGNQKDGLKIVGVGENVEVANTTKYAGGKATGAIWQAINLENVTITNTVYTMADGGNATFTNVYFAAGFRQGYGKNVVFTDCAFGSNSEGYALHFQTDAASEGGNITLTGCEFEGGKVHLGGKRAYTFTGCDFAVSTDFQIWSNITLDGCTVDDVEVITAENITTVFPNLDTTKVTLK